MNNLINHVSPEAAGRLKAAGFPQPAPEVGQFWYDDLNRPVCVRVAFAEYVAFSIFGSLENMSADNEFVKNHCSFAPTATDILRGVDKYFISITLLPNNLWRLNVKNTGAFFTGHNPAEAAALLFFYLKGIPAQK